MNAVDNARHALRRQIDDAQEKLRTLENMPSRDDYEDGSVVRVVVRPRYGGDEPLTYVFLKVVDLEGARRHGIDAHRWYFTGVLAGRGHTTHNQVGHMRFDQLVSWLVSDVELLRWTEMTPKTVGEIVTEMTRGQLFVGERDDVARPDAVTYHDDRS